MNGELVVVSFEEASTAWLKWAQERKRKPMRATSIPTVQSALDKWLIPHLGKLPLDKVHSGACKPLVRAMQDAGLSSRTQNMYVQICKSVVASVVDPESGEPLIARKWNPVHMDLPVIEHKKTPCFTSKEIEELIASLPKHGWERTLYALLAASGLRISEALALERMQIIETGGRTLSVHQQVSRFGKIVKVTKTKAGTRMVDLCPEMANLLMQYIARGRKLGTGSELLFPTREGTPQLPRNLMRVMEKSTDHGFHSFRRYRQTWLSEMDCNRDLMVYWMGHSPTTMSEVYSKLSKKAEFRLKEAERIGLGFDPHRQIVKAA